MEDNFFLFFFKGGFHLHIFSLFFPQGEKGGLFVVLHVYIVRFMHFMGGFMDSVPSE
jgi:hypothetical protein